MTPYRHRHDDNDVHRDDDGALEHRTVLWVLFVAGFVPVLAMLLQGGSWTAIPTIGLLMATLSGSELAFHYARMARAALRRRRQ